MFILTKKYPPPDETRFFWHIKNITIFDKDEI